MAQKLKRLPAMRETWVWSLGREDPREKEMATHSSILAWRIPWTEEPGGLQSTGLQRVGHNWATSLHQRTIISRKEKALNTEWVRRDLLPHHRIVPRSQPFTVHHSHYHMRPLVHRILQQKESDFRTWASFIQACQANASLVIPEVHQEHCFHFILNQ